MHDYIKYNQSFKNGKSTFHHYLEEKKRYDSEVEENL